MVKKFHGDPFSMVILFHGNDYHKTSLPYNEKKSMVRLFTINTIYGYHGMPTPGRELRKELRALGLHIKQKTVWNEEIYLENFALFGRIDHSAGKDHVISGSDEE